MTGEAKNGDDNDGGDDDIHYQLIMTNSAAG